MEAAVKLVPGVNYEFQMPSRDFFISGKSRDLKYGLIREVEDRIDPLQAYTSNHSDGCEGIQDFFESESEDHDSDNEDGTTESSLLSDHSSADKQLVRILKHQEAADDYEGPEETDMGAAGARWEPLADRRRQPKPCDGSHGTSGPRQAPASAYEGRSYPADAYHGHTRGSGYQGSSQHYTSPRDPRYFDDGFYPSRSSNEPPRHKSCTYRRQ